MSRSNHPLKTVAAFNPLASVSGLFAALSSITITEQTMPELSALLASASLGSMLFFSTVIAPTVFQVLDKRAAGQFLRNMFPKYFVVNGLIALFAAVLAFRPLESALLALCAALMIGVRQFVIPIINHARDAMLTGDIAAKTRFDGWHRVSVVVNLIEMILLAVAIYLLIFGT